MAYSEEPLGAGSGGQQQVNGSQSIWFQGLWGVGAGQVKLYAEDHNHAGTNLDSGGDPIATLAAIGKSGETGRVLVIGTQGVRIVSQTNGDPAPDHESISGVEVQVGDEQFVHIMRGMDPWGNDHRITMAPQGIAIHCGTGEVSIDASEQITLKVAGGTSSITLAPTGIVLKGPIIQIN
jgi:hypothetical protein